MEKRTVENINDCSDELEETEFETDGFAPSKPGLRQFFPMLLFLCLFLLLGSDFFVRNEICGKWSDVETIDDTFSAVFVLPRESIDTAHLEETKEKIHANKFASQKLFPENGDSIHPETLRGTVLLISDKWRLEPLLYRYRNESRIKGFAIKNSDESFWDYIRMKWERLLIAGGE